MSMPVIDPNDKMPKPKSPELPEVGQRRVKIVRCEEQVSKAGNSMLKFTMRIIAGQQGAGAWIDYYLTTGGDWYIRNARAVLEAFGYPTDTPQQPVPEMFIGRTAIIQVKHETSPDYPPKAVVHYWLERDPNEPVEEPEPPLDDDDVPF